ncbi:MAG: hypothetical protein PHW92_09235 [Lutibacter sp.]|nr:hypothetical protein [Lutibacter sp.]
MSGVEAVRFNKPVYAQYTVKQKGKVVNMGWPFKKKPVAKEVPFRAMGKNEDPKKYLTARANYYFKMDIESGRLKYIPAKPHNIIVHKWTTPEKYTYYPKAGDTFGKVKGRYNLPDGIFDKYFRDLENPIMDRDNAKIHAPIEIPPGILRKVLHGENPTEKDLNNIK